MRVKLGTFAQIYSILFTGFKVNRMNDYEGIDERIVINVKAFAKKLSVKNRNADLEDIEQELMLHVIKGMRNFDPNLGDYDHFLRRILSCTGKNILKRNSHRLHTYQLEGDIADTSFASTDLIDLQTAIESFPNRYKLICSSLRQCSVMEIAEMLHLSKASIYRDLQFVRTFFRTREHSPEEADFLLKGRFIMKNLSVIETMDVKKLSQLEVYDLADLSDQIAKLVNHTKELKEKLEDALNLRFSETVQSKLRDENKDTSTTKFYENGFQIVAEVPKKVTWDSDKIDEIIKTISDEKRKAIIKTTHVIDERKYTQLSPEDKQLFADARTVTPGKTKFKISVSEDQRDVGSINF